MPALGSQFLYGNRDYIFNKEFYRILVEEHGVTLSYEDCKKLIENCNKNIAQIIVEENDGFKLPYGLGYICATRFIPKNPAIDWKNSNKTGKRCYHLNLHTFGYSCRAQWYRVGQVTNAKFHEVYKFASYKTLSQAVSKAFAKGKMYSQWSVSDFISLGRLENLYNKKYRKKELKA